jgi:hypothetical protein
MINPEKERKFSSVEIEEILKKYNISPPPSPSFEVTISDNTRKETFTLMQLLQLPSDMFLKHSLEELLNAEERAIRALKHGGRRRPRREVRQIREQFSSKEEQLRQSIGLILATIVCNPGRNFLWSKDGLRVEDTVILPSPEEISWWGWVYNLFQRQREKGNFLVTEDGRFDPRIYAFFLMRRRAYLGEIDSEKLAKFTAELTPLVGEEEGFIFGEIARMFPPKRGS